MKAMLRTVVHGDLRYEALMFCCPGCAEQDGNTGFHMLPVSDAGGKPQWTFDGNLKAPTLSPSILTTGAQKERRCHSFLRSGVFEFLGDCTHSLAGQHVPMPDLPEWVLDES